MRFVALLLLALSVTLHAQQPIITLDTQPTTPQLHDWLHSADPRLIAWAATLTAKMHDKTILAEMPSVLEHWTIPSEIGNTLDLPQREQRRAAEAVLDALIQENTAVPVSTIRSTAEFFPGQALTLVARLPSAESKSLLHDWTYGATGAYSGRLLASVASRMLAKDPSAGFIEEILRDSEEQLTIVIVAKKGVEFVSGVGATCGDSMGADVALGWPEVFTYTLEESKQASEGIPVVTLDDDAVVAVRHSENRGWGTCIGVPPLNSVTRHRLIAHWLGLTPRDMAWQPVESEDIAWTSKPAYEQQLGAILETRRHRLQETVDLMVQRHLIHQGITPQLRITIRCDIKPCPLRPAPTPATGMEIFIPQS